MSLVELQQSNKKLITESNGHVFVPQSELKSDQTQCPGCGRVYVFAKPPGVGTKTEKEQHLSGFCSDLCWIGVFSR
jgi:hypothetical protein